MDSQLISIKNQNDLKRCIQKRSMDMALESSNIRIKLTQKQQERLEKREAKLLEKQAKLLEKQMKKEARLLEKQIKKSQKTVRKTKKQVLETTQREQHQTEMNLVTSDSMKMINFFVDPFFVYTQKQINEQIAIENQQRLEIFQMQNEDTLSRKLTQQSTFQDEIEEQNEQIINNLDEMFTIFNSEEMQENIGGTQKGKNKKANRTAQQKLRQQQNRVAEKLRESGKFDVVKLDSVSMLNVNSKPQSLKAFSFDLNYRGGDSSKEWTKIHKDDYRLDKNLAKRQFEKKVQLCTNQLSKLVDTVQANYSKQTQQFGKTVKIVVQRGDRKKVISEQINNKKDIQKLVYDILKDTEFYEDFQEDETNVQTKFSVSLSQGLVGDVKMVGQNCKSIFKDALIISPNTQTRCFASCLAILQLIDEKVEECLIYGKVKELQDQISKNYNLVGTGGISHEQLVAICSLKNIRIFKLNEKIDQNGIIVSSNHCLVALENNEQNLAYCQILENNYFAQRDQVMTFNKEKMIKPSESARPKLYVTYDSEFTKDSDQLKQKKIQGEKLHVKELAFSFQYHAFMLGEKELKEDVVVKVGEKCRQEFVDEIYNLSLKYKNCDLIFYGHNANKCDYPIFSKYLTKYFSKDNLDFSSRMSTIAYRWNLGEQIIQFQDTLNIFPGNQLKEVLKTYGNKDCQKLEVNHNLINIQNWESQWDEQNMEEYSKIDVLGLSHALINYNNIIKKTYGFPLLEHNNILSNSSLSQKAYLFNAYDQKESPVYQMPKEYEERVGESFLGGSCQPFRIDHLKNIRGFSADINSAYPWSMCRNLPTGPYYRSQFNFLKYEGQKLQSGVYQIYIKKSNDREKVIYYSQPATNGIQQPCIVKNKITRKTSIEVEYMFSKGNSEIYLIDAILSKTTGKPLEKFVREVYEMRCQNKKMQKIAEKNGEEEKAKTYEGIQLLQKNVLNSLYGKYALRSTKDEKNFTTSEDIILDLCKNGTINHYEEKTVDGLKIYEFDANVSQQSNYSNLMIAAFITAYTRIYLNQMQEKLVELGFTLLYSDTDSVYFYCEDTWSSKKINEQMKKFSDIYCDESELGKCKFETEDDIGKSHLIWNQQNPNEEPLRHAFFDECIVLCSKTYALKSNLTGQEFLKAKGIPAWMIENKRAIKENQETQLQRCLYNGNERQFKFQDYVDCLNGNPFQFEVVQTSVIKKNMYNDEDLKQTQKIIKKVDCLYTQKKIQEDGSLKYYKINGHADVCESQLEQKQENNCEGEYQIYQTIEQIKDDHEIENDDDYQKWLAKQIIVRRETNNKHQFLLFKNHPAFVKYFNNQIKNSTEKNHHLITSKFNQPIQFDIDLQRDENDDDYLESKQAVQDMIKDIIRTFQLEDLEYELIDRCRQTKVSYHLRFAGKNWNYNLYRLLSSKIDDVRKTLKKNTENNIKNRKKKVFVKLPETTLLEFIDEQIYKTQFRITAIDEKFLFNPNNFVLTPKLSEDQLKRLQEVDTQFKTQMQTKADIKIEESHKKICEEWLKQNKMDNMFSYRSSKGLQNKRQVINLFHKKGVSFNCKDCDKKHDNDHCTFLEIYFDTVVKKQTITMKCYKALQKK